MSQTKGKAKEMDERVRTRTKGQNAKAKGQIIKGKGQRSKGKRLRPLHRHKKPITKVKANDKGLIMGKKQRA